VNELEEALMLTTEDNPYNPFTQYDEWLAFDRQQGYYTNEYLARVVSTINPIVAPVAAESYELSPEEEELVAMDAITQIVLINLTGNYKAVRQSDFTT
jgi:hypothetical protein